MLKALLAIVGALAVAACGPTGTLQVDGQLSKSSALTQTRATSAGLELTGSELTIKQVRVAVSEIELEGGAEDEREAELGEAVIEVALDGKATQVTVDSVDAGSYHTLGIELQTALSGGSIEVVGTHKGSPFTFRSALTKEVEFRLQPEVNVPENGRATVAVSFDVAAWFKTSSGILDPTDRASQAKIEAQILRTLAARAVIEDADGDSD